MSNEPTIDQMNEAIAVFNGWTKHEDDQYAVPYFRNNKGKFMNYAQSLEYHTSWDKLKPVIDEIFKYALAHPEEVRPIREMSIVVNIQAAHEKVYKFCKWLNQQKQKDGTT